ncbi:S-formylglutathione hydrolase [Anabaena cylindrica UHCC 0172]|uniref:S-formylglutathione hydrolase n=1 Tax=Anabaena cylindrica TaxID=1165 RepID=UPI002B1F1EEE|nr:S-formylglutathione hydrolase [Anabaena cylindrica]MEA5554292.1 S-formylglutathione hydrolase [Anabaena cylindrica UHCC 0172]
MTNLNLISEFKCFDGTLGFYSHISTTCNGEMRFAVYQPPQARKKPLPVLYFLSGLTCREDNFMVKSGAQRWASEYGIIIVAPDTSPRNTGIVGEDDEWDIGTGAGFYVDATEEPWRSHYRMYSYIIEELPSIVNSNFPTQPDKQSIFGHSMGGHGALVCAMRNPKQYKSVSAFAPIVAPMGCPWGKKAFSLYLGNNQENWRDYDASELVQKVGYHSPILIDQGTADKFLTAQLLPDVFAQACLKVNQPLNLRYQPGYDHSYYFISTFMSDHIHHHAIALHW